MTESVPKKTILDFMADLGYEELDEDLYRDFLTAFKQWLQQKPCVTLCEMNPCPCAGYAPKSVYCEEHCPVEIKSIKWIKRKDLLEDLDK